MQSLTRRQFRGAAGGALSLAAFGSPSALVADDRRRPKVAAVVTEFTYRSHAHVILENFLKPYYFNGKLTESGMEVAGLYVDQFPEKGDMARAVSKEYGIPIYPTIGEALRLGGSDLAVDGVLSIGEHGHYPLTDRGQIMYPRKRFFDEIAAVFRKSGRAVPLFNDKHLSYRFDWSVEMMDVAWELGIPFMAGSSVPLAQRRPPLELPPEARIEEAVSIHGGPPDAYDFHALEVLQSMVEARHGGETGVSEIQLIEGDDVWKAAMEGRWSLPLAQAAMQLETNRAGDDLRNFTEEPGGKTFPVHAILIKYRDGLRGTILRIGNSATRWHFACRLAGKPEPLATRFYVGPWQNRNLFKALSHAIQTHIREGKAPYPVERTHLVTGMLAAAMDSRFGDHQPLATPQLEIAYAPRDYRAMREMGDSWKIITEEIPEPPGIDPIGAARKQ
jgi:hypothetical protein